MEQGSNMTQSQKLKITEELNNCTKKVDAECHVAFAEEMETIYCIFEFLF